MKKINDILKPFGEQPSVKIAAMMLSDGINPDVGLLNASLVGELLETAQMVTVAGGTFKSRQAVALAIKQWQHEHPKSKAYGE